VTIITSGADTLEYSTLYLVESTNAFVALVVSILMLVTAKFQKISEATLQNEVAKLLPVVAANTVAEKSFTGPLFNDFNRGSYLIWRLPHLTVAIDGRGNLHHAERMICFDGILERSA
jgi:hypothetical protein